MPAIRYPAAKILRTPVDLEKQINLNTVAYLQLRIKEMPVHMCVDLLAKKRFYGRIHRSRLHGART